MYICKKILQRNLLFSTIQKMSSPDKKPPMLKGIRVLDLSRILVGPFSSMILSDLGAEVIKVESFDGDDTRKWGPPFNGDSSTYFLSLNRNKKSIAINLKSPDGLKTIYDLAKICDIFLENFSTSVPKALKIDYDIIKLHNPKIVYGSVSGYGYDGPLLKSPGFDATIQSYSGLMDISGQPDGEPTRVGFPLTDVLTGQLITNGILAGLFHRERTGEGSYVKTSLFETALSSMANMTSAHLNGGVNPTRIGNHHPSIAPYGTFKVKDSKYITIACGTEQQFKSLMNILQMEIPNQFKTNKDRVINRLELIKLLNDVLSKWDLDVFMTKLVEAKIPAMPLNDIKTALASPQTKALGLVKDVKNLKHHKNLRFVGIPLHFEGFNDKEMEEPPLLNEQANYILKDLLKYDDSKIQALIKKKAILDPKTNAFAKI